MSSHEIHVFISHAWEYSNHYETLSSWIFKENWSIGQASLIFQDYSVPKNDPIHNAPTDMQLKNAIYNKISRSHIIVIPSGMYASHSKWIQKEIEGSKHYNKPILAVNPFGQQRKSGVVIKHSNDVVRWNKKPVINAIWNLYRG